ncbi:hypothetical protein [Embleya sp. AB8]|uniref:hypothetical protein n=1 Tax=Embleya sp. AB8 TaxID=3156304 RepID=UPI003C709EA4
MSNSKKRDRQGKERARYTEESASAAKAGTPRGLDSVGLDHCTPEQTEFRALLALGFFNRGPIAAWPSAWDLSALTWYTITVSPGWDYLFLHTNAPDNVADRMDPRGGFGMPGIRLMDSESVSVGEWWIGGIHLHTGARLTLAGIWPEQLRPRGLKAKHVSDACVRPFLGETMGTTESRAFTEIPPMSDDMRRLLAGLFVRLSVKDRFGRWATGNWHWDPLRRNLPRPKGNYAHGPVRRLWGAGDEWELVWTGYPHTADVVAALTDPVAGLANATSITYRDSYDVRLGTACLHIRRWQV